MIPFQKYIFQNSDLIDETKFSWLKVPSFERLQKRYVGARQGQDSGYVYDDHHLLAGPSRKSGHVHKEQSGQPENPAKKWGNAQV